MTRALAIATAIVAILAGASSALAQPPVEHNPKGRLLGVVEPHGNSIKNGSGGLVYHNGPVMVSNATYLVFWGPAGSFDNSYVSLINRYFGDVSTDSTKPTNVYSIGTQYYQQLAGSSQTFIHYMSSFSSSHSVMDTTPYGANGCKDRYTRTCVSDAQLQAELQSLISTHGWPTGTGAAYFIFTPPGVGSCGSGVGCAFSSFCAYHGWIGTDAQTAILYANMPYADQVPGCGSGESPNGNHADATLDGASHEHNEMITDPVGTGWYTKSGYEQGDLCNFVYGSPVASSPPATSGVAYNQVINSNPYWIQEEWSNSPAGCLQHLP